MYGWQICIGVRSRDKIKCVLPDDKQWLDDCRRVNMERDVKRVVSLLFLNINVRRPDWRFLIFCGHYKQLGNSFIELLDCTTRPMLMIGRIVVVLTRPDHHHAWKWPLREFVENQSAAKNHSTEYENPTKNYLSYH